MTGDPTSDSGFVEIPVVLFTPRAAAAAAAPRT
jgi:hypothetical protein